MRILLWNFPNTLLYNFSCFGQRGWVLRASNARPYILGFRERIISHKILCRSCVQIVMKYAPFCA